MTRDLAMDGEQIQVLPAYNGTVYRYREIVEPDKLWLLRAVTKTQVMLIHDVTRNNPTGTMCVRHLISWEKLESDFERVEVPNLLQE